MAGWGVGIAIVWSLMSLGMGLLLIKGMVSATWNRIASAHPAVEPAAGSVRRDFQSFKMNLFNMGMCVHVIVDERHLHLLPAAFLRWFGAKPMSVAWERIEVKRRSRVGSAVLTRIHGVDVWGPGWCLEMAGPTTPSAPPRR